MMKVALQSVSFTIDGAMHHPNRGRTYAVDLSRNLLDAFQMRSSRIVGVIYRA